MKSLYTPSTAILMFISLWCAKAQTIMNIHQSNGTELQIPLNTIDSITYTINNPGVLATLSTLPIGNITSTSATSGGNITANGGTSVTQRGVVWSTSPNPTTANSLSSNGSGTGNYTSTLSGLAANTTYYLRAYAINSAGTAYGNQLTFTTAGGVGSITALNCSSSTNNGSLVAGAAVSGVSSVVPYTGGNGGAFIAQIINSTGVTGLTATLLAGNFNIGNGSLTFTINGTPSTAGTANFNLNIGGQNCTLSLTVNAGSGIVSNLGAGVTFNGYTYSSVVLGNGQEWMAENLRTITYRNGDPIPNVTGSSQWSNLTSGAWAHYNNNSQYETPYGKLYNWYAVADPRNVCPTGWHVPTDAEWTALTDYLGGEAVAGGKMKSVGTIEAGTGLWYEPNTDATNESGFTGLPAGSRSFDGIFDNIGSLGPMWSSSELATSIASNRILYFSSGTASMDILSGSKLRGFSVRCLRD
jgi:uncharacterized protein (TIGR02145 family)